MSNLVKTCSDFLQTDLEGFRNPNFKHAEFIVGILRGGPNGDFTGKYIEFEEREKDVDELVSRIVHERFDEFSSLIDKPIVFGEKYDIAKKLISTARKKIKRSKELVEKKNTNLKQSLYRSVYNKEILNMLEKVEACNALCARIDSLIKNKSFYEVSENILKLRVLIEGLKEYDSTLVIKNLRENEKIKTQETLKLINTFFRIFFYYYEQEFDWDSLEKIDTAFKFDKLDLKTFEPGESKRFSISRNFLMSQQIMSKKVDNFKDILMKSYAIAIENFDLFGQKLDQIKTILSCPPKNIELNYKKSFLYLAEPEVFENIHIFKYITYSLEFNQFEKYSGLIRKADAMQKEIMSQVGASDIMNLFQSVKAADHIGIFPSVFNEFFSKFRQNIKATFMLIQIFFIDSLDTPEEIEEESEPLENQNDFSALFYGNLSHVDSTSVFNNIGKTVDLLENFLKKELFAQSNFDPKNCKLIIDFFKQIVMTITVYLRKNGLLQILIAHFKKNVDKIALINLRETWKIVVSEFEELFDRIFKMRSEVDLSSIKDPNEFFEASFLPSRRKTRAKTMKDLPASRKGSDNTNSVSLDDFLSKKLIKNLDLNFIYIPLVLNVIYKPLIHITTLIEAMCSRTAIRELVKESKNMGSIAFEQINNFYSENIDKFMLIFKIEYIKLIHETVFENKMNPIKNPEKEKKNIENKKIVTKKSEESKLNDESQPETSETKPEEDIPKPVKNETKNLGISDIKEYYSNLKYFYPEIANLSTNMFNLNKLVQYLPVERTSGMLDLLNWSMNACFQEVSYKIKTTLQGTLALTSVETYKDSEHLKFSTGLNKMKDHIIQTFPIITFKSDMASNKKAFKKAFKQTYKNYFSAQTFIQETVLMANDKQVSTLINIIDNLEVFLKIAYSIFWNIIVYLPMEDLRNLSLGKITQGQKMQSNDFNFFEQNEKHTETIEKLKSKLLNEGIDAFLAKFSGENLNLKEPSRYNRHITQDKPDIGFLKFLGLFKDLVDLMMKAFSCLIIELHLRTFSYLIRQSKSPSIVNENKVSEISSQNFNSLFKETYLFYETLKNGFASNMGDFVFEDYYPFVTKIIKMSFQRSEKTNTPFVKNYLHNILSLEKNLSKFEMGNELFEEKEAYLAKLKRYLNLFLIDEEELKNYLTFNKVKVKRKEVKSFIDLKMKELKTESKIQEKEKFFNELLNIFKDNEKK